MKKTLLYRSFFVAIALTGSIIAAHAQDPTTNPPTPTRPATKVVSIYSDAYTNVTGANYNAGWGQTTTRAEITISGNKVSKYVNLNYLGMTFNRQAVSDMTHLHIDVWCNEAMTIDLSPINAVPQQEQAYQVSLLAAQWNSFDIPLSVYNTMNFNAIYQFKINGAPAGKTIYVDNLYFYNNSTETDTAAPTNFTASAGTASYNSIELLLNANDNSGVVIYDITYGGTGTSQAQGVSGTALTHTVSGLTEGVAYTFSIIARDRSGNIGETKTVPATTLASGSPAVSAPTPIYPAASVMSIYSNAYTPVAGYAVGSWGQSTAVSNHSVGTDNIMKLTNLNYLGLEISGNTPIDYSAMNKLHIDIWTPNATSFSISPISTGAAEKQVACTPLPLNTWNSFDIPLSDFSANNAAIFQLKMIGTGTAAIVFLDNIYFYNDGSTGIEQTNEILIRTIVENGTLYVLQAEGKNLVVYNLSGSKIYNGIVANNRFGVELSKGVYLVNIDGTTNKVVIN